MCFIILRIRNLDRKPKHGSFPLWVMTAGAEVSQIAFSLSCLAPQWGWLQWWGLAGPAWQRSYVWVLSSHCWLGSLVSVQVVPQLSSLPMAFPRSLSKEIGRLLTHKLWRIRLGASILSLLPHLLDKANYMAIQESGEETVWVLRGVIERATNLCNQLAQIIKLDQKKKNQNSSTCCLQGVYLEHKNAERLKERDGKKQPCNTAKGKLE